MNRFYKYIGASLVALFLYSCATVPLTGRRQLSLVSDKEIQNQATQAYRAFLNDSKTRVVTGTRSEEHTSELQSRFDLVCRLLLEKKNQHMFSSCLLLIFRSYSCMCHML